MENVPTTHLNRKSTLRDEKVRTVVETAEERMWSQSSVCSEKRQRSDLYRNLHITPATLKLHANTGLHISADTSVATDAATFHKRTLKNTRQDSANVIKGNKGNTESIKLTKKKTLKQ